MPQSADMRMHVKPNKPSDPTTANCVQPSRGTQEISPCDSPHRASQDVNRQPSSSSCKGAGQSGGAVDRYHEVRTARVREHDGAIRNDTCWQEVQHDVEGRTGVDQLVCASIPQVGETGPQVDDSLHRLKGAGGRELESQGASDTIAKRCHEEAAHAQEPDATPIQDKAGEQRLPDEHGRHGQGDPGRDRGDRTSTMGSLGDRRRLGSPRSSESRRTNSPRLSGGRCPMPSNQTPEHGEHAAAGGEPHSSHREFRRSFEVEPLESWDALVAAGDIDGPESVLREPNQSKMNQRFHRLIHQISQELESVIQKLENTKTRRVNLFEVFCGNQSRLTQQVQQLHGTAVRFSKDRTDLMTVEGRRVLFAGLGEDNPEHVNGFPQNVGLGLRGQILTK